MTEENVKSLAEVSQNLLLASDQICDDLPCAKRKRAEARLRNLRNAMNSHVIADGDIVAAQETLESIKSMAVDSWRLVDANERICADLPHAKRKRADARLRNLRRAMNSHIMRLLAQNGIEMPDFTGKPYDANYPIRAVNADEFADGDILLVQETLEPALVKGGRVLHFAKVVLARAENSDKQPEKQNASGD